MWTVIIKHVCFIYTFANHFNILKGSAEKYFHFYQDVGDWKSADGSCNDQNGNLTRITDLKTFSSIEGKFNVEEDTPFWSAVRGLFTPWIAYRGCFPQPTRNTYNFTLKPNSVGNCFLHCKNQASNPNGCEYFALSGETCFCPCTFPGLQLADGVKCSITCNNSTDDGFCGGIGYITLYQVNNTFEGDGFCLAYNCESRDPLSSGHDCDEIYEGYCVDRKDLSVLRNQPSSSWKNYAMACKEQKLFLTAYIPTQINNMMCHGYVWTGIRTYKIHHLDGDEDCYVIKRKLDSWLYEKVNCFQKHPFVCQTNQINKSDATMPSLLRIPSQSSNTGLVAGSITGVFILITAALLTLYCIKRKQKSGSHTAPPVHNSIYDVLEPDYTAKGQKDAFYMNTVSKETNQQKQFYLHDGSNVYVEKADGEYDCLRSSRPKRNIVDEESQYDISENAYSTATRKEQNVEMHGSHYDYMTHSEENPYDSKSNQENMDGSHYSSSVGNLNDLKSKERDIKETSYYNTTLHE